MNAVDYATSSTCDACVSVLNPETQKQVTVKITNVCPECPQGNIDLSDDAFDAIRGDNPGVAPIQWNYVPCDVGDTPIIYTFKSGSSRAWTAIHVRNGRYPVSSIEYRGASEQEWTRLYWSPPGGEWIWGYLTASEGGGGPGNNPVSVRVTDVKGHVLEEELTLPLDQEGYEALEEDADIISPRGLQFPE
jgi:expansin (peptidoglycan-binding protein)